MKIRDLNNLAGGIGIGFFASGEVVSAIFTLIALACWNLVIVE